jgi:hypothetical protein
MQEWRYEALLLRSLDASYGLLDLARGTRSSYRVSIASAPTRGYHWIDCKYIREPEHDRREEEGQRVLDAAKRHL